MKILVIDDDPDARMIMEKLMQRQGYEVVTASRRDEAFTRLQTFHPSVILLDVLLSGADGREVCREIKSMEEFRNTPVIMISAHPGAAENFASYGADDFVTKPFRTQALLEKLELIARNA